MAEDEEAREGDASREMSAEIDRLEDGETAVLLVGEDRKTQVDFPLSLLPDGATEGDHLRITISIEKESRREASSRVSKLQEKLSKQGGAEGQKDFKL